MLVTTQNQDLKHRATVSIYLEALNEEDGAQVLLKYLNHGDEQSRMYLDDLDNAKVISRELEGLPIALAHVAGYIDQARRPFSDFLNHFRERQNASILWSMDSRASTTQQYERTLDAVWDIALSALGDEARAVIDVLAMLSPDSIPEKMLLREEDRDPMRYASSPSLSSLSREIRELCNISAASKWNYADMIWLYKIRSNQDTAPLPPPRSPTRQHVGASLCDPSESSKEPLIQTRSRQEPCQEGV